LNTIAFALRHGALATFVLAAIAGGPAFAQESPSACHAIADPTSRLVCYDRVTERPDPYLAASPGTPPTGTSATPIVAAPINGAAIPGAAGAAAAAGAGATTGESRAVTGATNADAPPAATTEPAPRSTRGLPAAPPPPTDALIEPSPIVKLEQTSIGRYRFHLGNGEVWDQLEPGRITLRQGDTVNVQQSTFGAWQMRAADGASRSVRVKRLE